jgi:hypothetical protein
MFGRQKLLDAIEAILRRHTWRKDLRIEQLERELKDARTWLGKVRDKNSALRRERRDLREAIKIHEDGGSSNSAG